MAEEDELLGCFHHCREVCVPRGTCDYTCPNNPDSYLVTKRWAEVDGKSLTTDNCAQLPNTNGVKLPSYIPRINKAWKRGKKSRNARPLDTAWAAVSLFQLFKSIGKNEYAPIAENGEELRKLFCLRSDCKIIAVGVGEDRHLERYWSFHSQYETAKALAKLDLECVTPPNFSYFLDLPKTHHIWNTKRILKVGDSFAFEGVATAPHVYATTQREWEFWTSFYTEQEHLNLVTLEFQTADSNNGRAERTMNNIIRFQDKLGRPIHPILVGGREAARYGASNFDSYTVTDFNPFIKATKRQILQVKGDGRLKWLELRTERETGLYQHINHNITTYAEHIEKNEILKPLDQVQEDPQMDQIQNAGDEFQFDYGKTTHCNLHTPR